MDVVKKGLKMRMGRMGVRFLKEGRPWRLIGLLYELTQFCVRVRRTPEGDGGKF